MNVCFVIDESLGEHGSETRSLLEETLTDDKVGETASLLEPPADPNQSGDLLEQTLVEESPDKSHALDDYDDDDFTGSSGGSTNRGSGKVLYFPVWGAQVVITVRVLGLKPLHLNINMHILHTALHTFLKKLIRRICLTINSFFSW